MYSTFHVLIIGVDNKALYHLLLAHYDKVMYVLAVLSSVPFGDT